MKRAIAVQTRRYYDGKVYSQVINTALEPHARTVAEGKVTRAVVIDRAKGRGMDMDTVLSRAQALANCLGVPYDEDLTWPCAATELFATSCCCPRCAASANERAKRK